MRLFLDAGFSVEEAVPDRILSDSRRLRQIIVNLIDESDAFITGVREDS